MDLFTGVTSVNAMDLAISLLNVRLKSLASESGQLALQVSNDRGITEGASAQRAAILEESIDARKLLPGTRLSSF